MLKEFLVFYNDFGSGKCFIHVYLSIFVNYNGSRGIPENSKERIGLIINAGTVPKRDRIDTNLRDMNQGAKLTSNPGLSRVKILIRS